MPKVLAYTVATLVALAALHAAAQTAPQSSRHIFLEKDLPDFPGREAVVYQVTYPPGTSNPPHRQDGHVFLHLLEGELEVQVKGGDLVTLAPGQSYYESPTDIHVVSRNPSATTPARAMVFMIHLKGAPMTRPVPE